MTLRRRERGAIALESVIIWPTVILALVVVMQGALWFHARNVALGAAQEGARVASAESRGDGAARAASFIADAGGTSVMTVKSVTQSDGATTVTVTVTGRAPSLVPGLSGPKVSHSATAPLKGWTTR
ncbi:TadE/TadG family type IV pilus assembly protein [Phytoactinopolyspora mesophila]|uniref:Pilus assembly protein n=1 Tax=Phytoactinopolyspora mesophila TaxID=2650750 RepID=A0A7K3M3K2_9ACTN|nr:TadE/TadG family type IV pilus assembly protein [Phytoactinopolyspora mesophila]NDL57028.1 pilus assembly protein [Phytoactinopolyspora mesophila]